MDVNVTDDDDYWYVIRRCELGMVGLGLVLTMVVVVNRVTLFLVCNHGYP